MSAADAGPDVQSTSRFTAGHGELGGSPAAGGAAGAGEGAFAAPRPDRGSKAPGSSSAAAAGAEGCWATSRDWLAYLLGAMSMMNIVLILLFAACVIALMVTSLNRLLLVPLALLPALATFLLYPHFRPNWEATPTQKEHLKQLDNLFVRSFCISATAGFVISLAIETLLTAGLVSVLFSADAVKEARAAFAARFSGKQSSAPVGVHLSLSVATVVFLFLTSYLASALVEETTKACFVRCSCCGRPASRGSRPGKLSAVACGQPDHLLTPRATALLLWSAAVGFATAENLVYTTEDSGSLEKGLATVLARTAIALPMQLVGSMLLAANLARRDFTRSAEMKQSWPMAMLGPVIFHGTFDLLVLSLPMILGRLGMTEVWLTVVNFVVSLTVVVVGAVFAFTNFQSSLEFVRAAGAAEGERLIAKANQYDPEAEEEA